MPSTRLIFGCGYLGARAAALWQEAGDAVYAVTRDSSRASEFQHRGWRPIVADVLDPLSLRDIPSTDTVLFAVARGSGSEVSMERLYVNGLHNVLAALPAATRRIIYISSTGVYAQDDGSWVDESSPTVPSREGGIASLAAEQLLAASSRGPHSIALRMAGLYGPGRVPRRDDLLAGRPLPDSGDGWLNLIHIDDAARVIVAAAGSAITGAMNGTDGHPVLRRDYQAEMARLLGAPPPRFETPADGAPTNQRNTGSKRVSNRQMVEKLSLLLKYPSYREGLTAILRAADC